MRSMSETVGNVQCNILTVNGPLTRNYRRSPSHVVCFLGVRTKIFIFVGELYVLLQICMFCNRVICLVKKLYVLSQSYMFCNRVIYLVKKLHVLSQSYMFHNRVTSFETELQVL